MLIFIIIYTLGLWFVALKLFGFIPFSWEQILAYFFAAALMQTIFELLHHFGVINFNYPNDKDEDYLP